MPPGPVRISIRDLSKTFTEGAREVPAVSRVSFDIFDNEFVAIVGPSGCGKSTILNMIGGLLPLLERRDPRGREDSGSATRRRPESATSSRRTRCFPGAPSSGTSRSASSIVACRRPTRAARVREAIHPGRPPGLRGRVPSHAVGRHAPARRAHAVAHHRARGPLIDEPFGALDTRPQLGLRAALLSLWEAERQTVIFVTHDL